MKIKPCKKCGSKDIKFWDCGYTTFNTGGGKCKDCGFEVKDGCLPWKIEEDTLIKVWNQGQKPTTAEKLKIEQRKVRMLRKQLRKASLDPVI